VNILLLYSNAAMSLVVITSPSRPITSLIGQCAAVHPHAFYLHDDIQRSDDL